MLKRDGYGAKMKNNFLLVGEDEESRRIEEYLKKKGVAFTPLRYCKEETGGTLPCWLDKDGAYPIYGYAAIKGHIV